MNDHTMTTGTPGELVCHWVAVTDPSGRTRLEARWAPRQGVVQDAVPAPHAA
jgi:hypothetical protein